MPYGLIVFPGSRIAVNRSVMARKPGIRGWRFTGDGA